MGSSFSNVCVTLRRHRKTLSCVRLCGALTPIGSQVAGKVETLFDNMKKSGIAAKTLAQGSDSSSGTDEILSRGGAVMKSVHALESTKDFAAQRDLKIMQRSTEKKTALAKVTAQAQQDQHVVSKERSDEDMDKLASKDLKKMEKAGTLICLAEEV